MEALPDHPPRPARRDLPVVLFGAFDRHNLGDLLFPHILTACLPGHAFAYAGLARRDLGAFGGHRVAPLDAVLAEGCAHLVHVGGELLTCSAYQAAVMLLPADAARAAVARYDGSPDAAAWAARQLGTARRIPYVVHKPARAGRVIFNAVGGVDWATLDAAQRAEVSAALGAADWVGVRDHLTHAALAGAGIDAQCCPDPVVMVKECHAERIRARQSQGEVQAVRARTPRGFLACQFSVDFADDRTLAALARGLSDVARHAGLALVFFRAGAAFWHDDLGLYEKLRRQLRGVPGHLFRSLDIWDICALIASSRGVVCSSLHGRIVATAWGLPRVSLRPPQLGVRPDKVAAYAATWEPASIPHSVDVADLAPALIQALALPRAPLEETARRLTARYRECLAQWRPLVEHNHG